ncbi:MAG: NAD(P)/FAD-dependent oxidoreductase [Candidatus Bathyarchaeia archaeon]
MNIAIIGGGIVGLTVAAELSKTCKGVFLFEKNEKFGQETSSHNSGVIHSGIHYPPGSLKAVLCVKANPIVYDLCEKHGISCKKLGKLTVATSDEEVKELEHLMRQGQQNGVPDLKMLSGEQVKKLEPNVHVKQALISPSTGIVEPDELMGYFYAKAQKNDVVFAFKTEVKSLNKTKDGYVLAGTSVNEKFEAKAKTVINCAGLHSDKIAQMAGLDIDKLSYRLHLCKGDYFRLKGEPPVKMLVYPLPKGGGLGIHLTPDMTGSIRLGPNSYYVNEVNYEVTSSESEFREDVSRFLPLVKEREIVVDSAGVRPKLQGPNNGFRDFVIRHEEDRGLPNLINLIGIESPGLTAAPAIAEHVREIYENEIR